MKKSQYEPYFKGKKITAMGIGLLGRGVGDISFMASCGADIIATDLRTSKTLKKSITDLKAHNNISYTLGKHKVGDFRNRDLVLHAAGIRKENKYLQTAQKQETRTIMSFGLVMDILRKEGLTVTLIGVTGTKGKSTTTGIIEEILKQAELRYHLAGNIRGVANLPLLKKIKDGDIILAELDSWQLQSMHDVKISPNIAVFTNFFEDHMNYYEGSMQNYFDDKAAIFSYQTKDDYLVYTHNSKQAISEFYKEKIPSKKILAKFSDLPKTWTYNIFGSHNQKNIAVAQHVGKLLKVQAKLLKTALTTFRGVDGRFQYLGTSTKRKLIFFNDNNSTTPSSTIESLNSLRKEYPNKKIILIGGGADKSFNYQKLAEYISKHVSYAFLFPGKATEKISSLFPSEFSAFTQTLSMGTAFNLALREAEDGSIIILSPAASSFGLFKNEYERNDQFVNKVKTYLRKS